MKVYLIFGHTGEYADRETWMIKKAFTNKESAISHRDLLNNTLKSLNAYPDENNDISWDTYINKREEIESIMRKLEPKFRLDYTGTKYEIEEAERED